MKLKRTKGSKGIRKALATFLTLALVISAFAVTVVSAFAAGRGDVVRDGDAKYTEWNGAWETPAKQNGQDTFFKDSPIGTITINQSMISTANNDNYTFSTTNPDFYVEGDSTKRSYGVVVYANNKNEMTAGADAFDVPGSFTITFPECATLQDGSLADVEITYSNMHIAPHANYATTGPVNAISGNFVGTRSNEPYDGTNYPAYGLRVDINMKVTQNGSPVAGTFQFSTWDLDVSGSSAAYSDASTNDNYHEAFQVLGGTASSIYIPTNNYNTLTDDGNGVKFTAARNPRNNSFNDDGTYESGFALLADAASGLSLRWWGQGTRMGTALLTGNLSHVIDSTTTKGGSIKTTTSGKVPGSSDAGDVLEPNDTVDNGGKCHLDVPDGKDVSYLMEPEDGYELGKIIVDGQEIDPDNSATWPAFIEVTKDENDNPIVTFKDNADDHTIDVTWDPIVNAKSGSGGSITDPGDTTVPFGKDKTYTATPEDGYALKTIKYNGEEVDPEDPDSWPTDENGDPVLEITKNEDGSYSITLKNVEDPAKLEVEWAKLYTVTFEDGDHGKSDGKGNEDEVPEGNNPKGGNGVTPNDGWEFSGKYKYVITKDDGTTEEGETDDPTSVIVTGDVVFTPVYDPIVTATSGSGGSISDPGDTTVVNGGSKTYTFTPEEGYRPGKVTVNGKEVTPVDNGDGTWSYTLENVTEPTTIDVQWEKIPETYWVTYVDPDGKTIYLEKTTVNGGDPEPAAPADPKKEGYTFDGWERSTDANGNVTYTAKWKPVGTPTPTPGAGTKTPTKTPIKPQTVTKTNAAPKTGDSTNMALWLVLLALAGAGAVGAYRLRKKGEL